MSGQPIHVPVPRESIAADGYVLDDAGVGELKLQRTLDTPAAEGWGDPPRATLPTEAVLLQPHQIDTTRWATRREESLRGRGFADLRKNIRLTHGNQVPILVRPLARGVDGDGDTYELVYGLRRLRACEHEHKPVLAWVQQLNDIDATARIVTENSRRRNLAPIEQGVFYKKLVDTRLYSSMRQLADTLGIDAGDVSRKVALANLPQVVLDAIDNPLRLTCAHAKVLAPMVQHVSPAALAALVQDLVASSGHLKPAALVAALAQKTGTSGVGNSNSSTSHKEPIVVANETVGSWSRAGTDRISLELRVSRAQEAAVLSAVRAALSP